MFQFNLKSLTHVAQLLSYCIGQVLQQAQKELVNYANLGISVMGKKIYQLKGMLYQLWFVCLLCDYWIHRTFRNESSIWGICQNQKWSRKWLERTFVSTVAGDGHMYMCLLFLCSNWLSMVLTNLLYLNLAAMSLTTIKCCFYREVVLGSLQLFLLTWWKVRVFLCLPSAFQSITFTSKSAQLKLIIKCQWNSVVSCYDRQI